MRKQSFYSIKDFQEKAKRTCTNLECKYEDNLHMEMGIITEVSEIIDILKKKLAYKKQIDKNHLSEEIADVLWYVVNDYRIRGMALPSDDVIEDEVYELSTILKDSDNTQQIFIHVSTMLKKYLIYKELYLLHIIATVVHIGRMFGVDYKVSMYNNIQKLLVRYPEKFDESLAIFRDLDKEKEQLKL